VRARLTLGAAFNEWTHRATYFRELCLIKDGSWHNEQRRRRGSPRRNRALWMRLLHRAEEIADSLRLARGVLVMASLFGLYPFLLKLYADGGYSSRRRSSASCAK
jgi:hypothetical protein